MEDMLQLLSVRPRAHLLDLTPPKFRSDFARRSDVHFRDKQPPAPMLYTPEAGLVLYERVITGDAEHQLIDKLAAPRSVRCKATGNSCAKQDVSQSAAPASSSDTSNSNHSTVSPSATPARPPPPYKSHTDRPGGQESENARATRQYFARERATISIGLGSCKLPCAGGNARVEGHGRFLVGSCKPPLRL